MLKAFYLAVLLSAFGCASPNEQWFFVPGASIQELNRHHELMRAFMAEDPPRLGYENKEFVVTGHRIEQGNGEVIAFRRFNSAGFLLADTATFEKVTALIPQSQFRAGTEIRIADANGAVVYYSASSSNFPGAGGCFGYASAGSIKVDSVSDTQVSVSLDLRFRLSSPLGYSGECVEKVMRGVFTGPTISLGQLSPWQGATGKDLYDETGPKRQ
jgi:hypothetical protein